MIKQDSTFLVKAVTIDGEKVVLVSLDGIIYHTLPEALANQLIVKLEKEYNKLEYAKNLPVFCVAEDSYE